MRKWLGGMLDLSNITATFILFLVVVSGHFTYHGLLQAYPDSHLLALAMAIATQGTVYLCLIYYPKLSAIGRTVCVFTYTVAALFSVIFAFIYLYATGYGAAERSSFLRETAAVLQAQLATVDAKENQLLNQYREKLSERRTKMEAEEESGLYSRSKAGRGPTFFRLKRDYEDEKNRLEIAEARYQRFTAVLDDINRELSSDEYEVARVATLLSAARSHCRSCEMESKAAGTEADDLIMAFTQRASYIPSSFEAAFHMLVTEFHTKRVWVTLLQASLFDFLSFFIGLFRAMVLLARIRREEALDAARARAAAPPRRPWLVDAALFLPRIHLLRARLHMLAERYDQRRLAFVEDSRRRNAAFALGGADALGTGPAGAGGTAEPPDLAAPTEPPPQEPLFPAPAAGRTPQPPAMRSVMTPPPVEMPFTLARPYTFEATVPSVSSAALSSGAMSSGGMSAATPKPAVRPAAPEPAPLTLVSVAEAPVPPPAAPSPRSAAAEASPGVTLVPFPRAARAQPRVEALPPSPTADTEIIHEETWPVVRPDPEKGKSEPVAAPVRTGGPRAVVAAAEETPVPPPAAKPDPVWVIEELPVGSTGTGGAAGSSNPDGRPRFSLESRRQANAATVPVYGTEPPAPTGSAIADQVWVAEEKSVGAAGVGLASGTDTRLRVYAEPKRVVNAEPIMVRAGGLEMRPVVFSDAARRRVDAEVVMPADADEGGRGLMPTALPASVVAVDFRALPSLNPDRVVGGADVTPLRRVALETTAPAALETAALDVAALDIAALDPGETPAAVEPAADPAPVAPAPAAAYTLTTRYITTLQPFAPAPASTAATAEPGPADAPAAAPQAMTVGDQGALAQDFGGEGDGGEAPYEDDWMLSSFIAELLASCVAVSVREGDLLEPLRFIIRKLEVLEGEMPDRVGLLKADVRFNPRLTPVVGILLSYGVLNGEGTQRHYLINRDKATRPFVEAFYRVAAYDPTRALMLLRQGADPTPEITDAGHHEFGRH